MLYAVCAITARLSDHPAIIKSPPSSNGQVYVARIRSRMPYLMSQVSLETTHIITLTAEAEYTAGNLLQGYRLDGIAQQMVIELRLHQLQRPVNFESESERIAFEIKCNTLNYFVCNETFVSIISGLPGVFLNIPINLPTPSNDPAWWLERIAVTGRPMDPVDNYTLSILHSIMKPRRLKGFGSCRPMFQLMEIGRSVWWYGNAGSEQNKCGVTCTETDTLSYDSGLTLTSKSAAEDSRPRDMMDGFKQLEAELEHWRTTVPEDWEPSRGRYSVSRTDKNVILPIVYYYVFWIILCRPLLIKACLSIVNNKSGQGGSRSSPDGGTKSDELSQDVYSEDNKDQQEESLQAVRKYLTKCVLAADEIIAMIGQFTDEEIRFCGPPYSFPMFIAGSVYVMQQFVDKKSNLDGGVEKKLATCHRFFQTLGPSYQGAADERPLVEFMVSTPSMFEFEFEDHAAGHLYHSGEESSSMANIELDLQENVSLKSWLKTPGKQKEEKPKVEEAMNAFMTTDTGVGTLWTQPERFAELEEATLLSLEKLSMVDRHISKNSS
ncbi:hypothetical protein EC991_007331 [Linnemannia zychae]|nr:hypothetical protein EC991_007331 [Linnemannia zychae]